MLKRIVPLVAVLAVLVGCLVVPASATVNYNNYISNISVDGANDEVTVIFPGSYTDWAVIRNDIGYHYSSGSSFTSKYDVPDLVSTDIYANILRPVGGLELYNIPNGTTINFLSSIRIDWEVYAYPPITFQRSLVVYYMDASGNLISFDTLDLGIVTSGSNYSSNYYVSECDVTFQINKPNNAYACYFEHRILFTEGTTYTATISGNISDLYLIFSISSLYRLQAESGRTNELLDEVSSQLEANGDKLDEIINGEVEPTPPAGSGSVGDLDDLESGLRDDSQAGLDQGLAMQQSALDIFSQYASAFAVSGLIFNTFANIPFFSFILYISVALGIFGLLVNLGVDASLASSRAKKRDQKQQQKQMIKKSRGK